MITDALQVYPSMINCKSLSGNSMIAVNGDEKVDLENTLLESLQVVTHLS